MTWFIVEIWAAKVAERYFDLYHGVSSILDHEHYAVNLAKSEQSQKEFMDKYRGAEEPQRTAMVVELGRCLGVAIGNEGA